MRSLFIRAVLGMAGKFTRKEKLNNIRFIVYFILGVLFIFASCSLNEVYMLGLNTLFFPAC